MTILRLTDLVECQLCSAVVHRDRRPLHLAWHARLNARVLTISQIREVLDLLHERGIDVEAPVA